MIDSKQKVNINWQVYIILCSDDSLYTGITTDIKRRYKQHLTGKGAKYFRGRSPRRLVYLESDHDRGSASRREAQIKKLRLVDKRRLITSSDNRLEEEKECVEVIRVPG
ncbi:MAG: GIY-YIG nuclease family protein [Desulfuromusa sp.]|nr:GIY-YIG nuclease family protein [Desulfuromusa sp.]